MLKDFLREIARLGPDRFLKTGIVDPPNVVQSEPGRYFVGRTGLFKVEAGQEALVLFDVPAGSPARAFVVSVTLTSNLGRRAVVYFGAETAVPMKTSQKVASAHRGTPDTPHSTIQMATGTALPLSAGVSVSEHLLVGGDTLVLEQAGRLILEPGEAIGVLFEGIAARDEVDVAFGWWEEPAG